MKIRIYMKNGIVLPDFKCDEFATQRNNLTGELTGYSFSGGKVPRPMYLDLSEILAIWRIDDDDDES